MPELKPSGDAGWCTLPGDEQKAAAEFNPWKMAFGVSAGQLLRTGLTPLGGMLGEAPARSGPFAQAATSLAHMYPLKAKSRPSRAAGAPAQPLVSGTKRFRGDAPFGLGRFTRGRSR